MGSHHAHGGAGGHPDGHPHGHSHGPSHGAGLGDRALLWAVAINLALLWLANAYMRHFAIAPVEWAWRSIVEGRRLPWRRAPLVAAVA